MDESTAATHEPPPAEASDAVLRLRFDRTSDTELITWWDQRRLRRARVLVAGAGAIGNEVLKNLALVGIGRIFLVDLDQIEESNLNRSILFRPEDTGRYKAEVAAAAIRSIDPEIKVACRTGNLLQELGLGLVRRMDLVIGCLDNREARLAINQMCWRVGTPWIDGGIDVLSGVVRVFIPPHSSCYECTMSEQDYKLLGIRYSCSSRLRREDWVQGKSPTTPTSAAIVGALQVQEALKFLHGLAVKGGAGLLINGLLNEFSPVTYPVREDCYSHDTFGPIIPLDEGSDTLKLEALLKRARSEVGEDAVIELDREIVTAMECGECGQSDPVFRTMSVLSHDQAFCPSCGTERQVRSTATIDGRENFLDKTWAGFGIPQLHIVTARGSRGIKHYEFSPDEQSALGSWLG